MSFTHFPTLDKAAEMAAKLNAMEVVEPNDFRWVYVPLPHGDGGVVEVIDAENHNLGWL